MKNKLKVLSLFSGCGGMDLGFVGNFIFNGKKYGRNNFDIVFSNDIDKDAESTYNANSKFFEGHTLTRKDIIDLGEDEIPLYDVLLAGFPCQPFSSAGKREGVLDKNGRGTRFYECYRILEIEYKKNNVLPKAFIFENVRSITSSKTIYGKYVPYEIKEKMESIGYNVAMDLVRCSIYGVPQNRYRYIIVGIRNDIGVFDFSLLDKIVNDYNIP